MLATLASDRAICPRLPGVNSRAGVTRPCRATGLPGLLLLVLTPLVATNAEGAGTLTPEQIEAIRASKGVTAIRIAESITIDGVLDEAVWKRAQPATDFYQQSPAEFAPSSRSTEVRFLYDEHSLYVGAMLFDDSPDRLIVNDLKREFSGRDTDTIAILIDTFLDRRTSYGFLTNPGGAVRDVVGFDNGRKVDTSWNGVWFVRTSVREDGWSAEMAIPFKTLRFPNRPAQEWGLNIMRVIRRDNEVSTWAPVPRQFSTQHMGYAGTLTGIQRVVPGRNVQVKPFATGQIARGVSGTGGWDGDGDGGLDLKWGITSSLLLDGTWRTDFSQVEADEQQINLTRFSLFFPEKREFFLENQTSFQIGLVEPSGQDARRDLVPFFSRQIGLSGDGRPIPVVGGVRLTGRTGQAGIGFLSMQTEDFEGRPGDNFTAAHLTRNLPNGAALGAFYFGREASGSADFNRVAGVDLFMAPRRSLEIEAVAMASGTAEKAADWAGRAGFRLFSHAHRARLGFVHVGDTFQHDLGFVRRRGIGTVFGSYARVMRPADTTARLREVSIGADLERTADDRYTELLTRIGGLNFTMLFSDGGQLNVQANTTFEHLDAPFVVQGSTLTIAPGQYEYQDGSVEYISNRSALVSGSLTLGTGEFWTGRQRAVSGGLRVRVNAHLAASTTLSRSVIHLPEGLFTADLAGFRVDCSFSPRMFLNAFIQYNGATDAWLSNIRYNFVHRPLSDIYVVWNETRLPTVTRRALMLKYTHLLSF
jgi:hypothetical protein